MKALWRRLLVVLIPLLCAPYAHAEEALLIVRSPQPFPESMLTLQQSIRNHGYLLSRVQRIDIGLTGMGYVTDKYRVVFFGKADEIRQLTRNYPDLIPYLPYKISIFAERDHTLLVAARPTIFGQFLPDGDAAGMVILERWEKDVRSILDDVRQTDD